MAHLIPIYLFASRVPTKLSLTVWHIVKILISLSIIYIESHYLKGNYD